jgi:hypothetical protein
LEQDGKIKVTSFVSAYESFNGDDTSVESPESIKSQFKVIIQSFNSNQSTIQNYVNYKQFVHSSLSSDEFLNLKNL